MGFAPVKPHGFPTFLHGKTPVFPTPFPCHLLLNKYRRDLKLPQGRTVKYSTPSPYYANIAGIHPSRGEFNSIPSNQKHGRLQGRPYGCI